MARLEFWLRLANSVPPTGGDLIPGPERSQLVSVQPAPKYSCEIEQEFVRRFAAQLQWPLRPQVVRRLKEALPSVALTVAWALRGFAHGSPQWFFERFDDISIGIAWKDGCGKMDYHFVNPCKLFLDDLREAAVARIRECPVCKSLFFAKRDDMPRCKSSCTNVRRVHIARGTWEEYSSRHPWNGYRVHQRPPGGPSPAGSDIVGFKGNLAYMPMPN